MWKYGEIIGLIWEAKVFNNPSMWGIADGRISKLWVREKESGREVYSYDRGPSVGDSISKKDLHLVLKSIDSKWDFSSVLPAEEEEEEQTDYQNPVVISTIPITISVSRGISP